MTGEAAPTGTWVLVGSEPDLGLPDGARVDLTLTLDEDGTTWAAGTAACNRYRGAVDVTGGVWQVQGAWAVTRRACPPPLLEAERVVLAALARVTAWTQPEPAALRLAGDGVALTFTVDRSASAPTPGGA